jgi:hypothetical protein
LVAIEESSAVHALERKAFKRVRLHKGCAWWGCSWCVRACAEEGPHVRASAGADGQACVRSYAVWPGQGMHSWPIARATCTLHVGCVALHVALRKGPTYLHRGRRVGLGLERARKRDRRTDRHGLDRTHRRPCRAHVRRKRRARECGPRAACSVQRAACNVQRSASAHALVWHKGLLTREVRGGGSQGRFIGWDPRGGLGFRAARRTGSCMVHRYVTRWGPAEAPAAQQMRRAHAHSLSLSDRAP